MNNINYFTAGMAWTLLVSAIKRYLIDLYCRTYSLIIRENLTLTTVTGQQMHWLDNSVLDYFIADNSSVPKI